MHNLRGRSAVLTGASYGVGPHIARALASEGVNVALAARSAPELERLAREISTADVRAVPIAVDLATGPSREALVARAEAELGPIQILVNNAGAHHGGQLRLRTSADIEQITQLNLIAPIELTRLLLPSMMERRSGHIVHVASLAGKVPMPFFSLYTATKYGLVGFNHALQAELRGTGVHSSVVCPGSLFGEGMWARLGGGVHPALGIARPERVARAVIDAMRYGRIEQIINPRPVRPVIALWGVAPRAAHATYQLLGIETFFRKAAERIKSIDR